MVHNTICHVEIQVLDLDRAQAFYEGLFGWRFSSFIPNMTVFGNGNEHIGGLMKVDEVKAGESPSLWFRVQNLQATLDKALELGGTLDSEPSEVPSVGWSATIRDLDGNMVGLVMYTEDVPVG